MRKRLLLIAALLAAFLLGACTVLEVRAEQEKPTKIWHHNFNGVCQTWVVVDDDTGVNYIVVSGTMRDSGTAITPRLNADGTLYVGK